MHTPTDSLCQLFIHEQSHALAYERGKILSIYVLALHEYKRFVEEKKLEANFDFVSSICELISVRPHVCSDAMDRFPDFKILAIAEVKNAFEEAMVSDRADLTTDSTSVVVTVPREVSDSTDQSKEVDVVVSSHLMQAAIILISNWQNTSCVEDEEQNTEEERENTEASVMQLLKYLVIPFLRNGYNGETGKSTSGAANAKYKHNGARAVSVEQVNHMCSLVFRSLRICSHQMTFSCASHSKVGSTCKCKGRFHRQACCTICP